MNAFLPDELAEWSEGRWTAAPRQPIAAVSNDSRTLPPGALYVALRGERFDGHAFVADAMRGGAAAALVEASALTGADPAWPLLAVDDSYRALEAIAAGYRRKVDPVIVGITGSVGKSTVKEMTRAVLEPSLRTAATLGNWNNAVGLPLSLLAMPADTQAGVFEIGTSQPGEIAALSRLLQAKAGIVTNIGPSHIEAFWSVASIAEEKAELLRSLPAEGLAVINQDGEYADVLRKAAPCRVVTVSLEGSADICCRRFDAAAGTAEIEDADSGRLYGLSLPQAGRHLLVDALLAAAVGRWFGLAWGDIAEGLRRFVPLPMRGGCETIGGVTFVNDAYNANPLSMRASLDAFAMRPVDGRKWLVLGDMLELGDHARAEHRTLGRVIATGDWHGLAAVGEWSDLMIHTVRDEGMDASRVIACPDVDRAADWLAARVRSGDAVLLKASRGIGLERVIKRFKATREQTHGTQT